MDMEGCLANAGAAISLDEMDQAILDRARELDDATRSDAKENLPEEEAP